MKKIYIGIDPDIRLLNAAIVTDTKEPLAVFVRRNKEGKDNEAVANAARKACRLIEDIIAYFVAYKEYDNCSIVTVIESQSMMHTKRMRATGRNVNYESIRRLSQVTGCLMGAFSNMSSEIYLIDAITWKGSVPKDIHHRRIYNELNIAPIQGDYSIKCVPKDIGKLSTWSKDKCNPGDFIDINDSLGLALYGAQKRL